MVLTMFLTQSRLSDLYTADILDMLLGDVTTCSLASQVHSLISWIKWPLNALSESFLKNLSPPLLVSF